MTKDDGLTSVLAGTTGHAYTITVTNSGPSDADSVRLDDVVPAALSAGSPSADTGGDCTASLGNTIACSLPASLAPGATWTITVPYAVGAAVPAQTVSNTATATSAENPAGVSASDATDITTSADLGVTIDDGLASVTAGDGLTHAYTVTVSNGGPSDATAVGLTLGWPAVFSQGSVTPVAGELRPDRRRARPHLQPGHDRGRRERHGQRRLHRPGQPPRRPARPRPRPSAARPSTRSPPTTARPMRRPSSRPPSWS